MNGHHLAELRSLALHGAIAERLETGSASLEAAAARVAQWRRDGSVASFYADAWAEALGQSLSQVCGLLRDRGERATALRQVSPFAGYLDARERWAIWRTVRPDTAVAR